MIEIQFKLKSFDIYYIQNAFEFIKKIVKFFGLSITQQIILPVRITKYTVLRSPHIDKKSREQFQKKRNRQLFCIYTSNIQLALILLKIFKKAEIPGVEIELHLKFIDYFIMVK